MIQIFIVYLIEVFCELILYFLHELFLIIKIVGIINFRKTKINLFLPIHRQLLLIKNLLIPKRHQKLHRKFPSIPILHNPLNTLIIPVLIWSLLTPVVPAILWPSGYTNRCGLYDYKYFWSIHSLNLYIILSTYIWYSLPLRIYMPWSVEKPYCVFWWQPKDKEYYGYSHSEFLLFLPR